MIRDVRGRSSTKLELPTVSGSSTSRVWQIQRLDFAKLDWPKLQAYLRKVSTLCLSADQRAQVLGEEPLLAQEESQRCQRLNGEVNVDSAIEP